jgi:hypothetical protein
VFYLNISALATTGFALFAGAGGGFGLRFSGLVMHGKNCRPNGSASWFSGESGPIAGNGFMAWFLCVGLGTAVSDAYGKVCDFTWCFVQKIGGRRN